MSKQIINVVLQVVILSIAVTLVMKLSKAVGGAVGQAGDDQLISPRTLITAQRRSPQRRLILYKQWRKFVQRRGGQGARHQQQLGFRHLRLKPA